MTAAVSDTTISDKVRVIFVFIVFSLFYETSGESVYSYLSVIRGTDSDLACQSVSHAPKSKHTPTTRQFNTRARDAPKSSGDLSLSLSLSSSSYYPALILCFQCLP